jgi:hypothetical protein
MREIVPGDSDDRAGVDAMTWLEPANDSNRHFLLPLPPGVDATDPELFGFYTYELRIGHYGKPHDTRWWSTAQGRYGRPLRVSGIQHPAPPLQCRAGRVRTGVKALASASASRGDGGTVAAIRSATLTASYVSTDVLVTATYATPVLNGRALVRPFETPRTTLCFLLYAQVVQADATMNRNVLLLRRLATFDPKHPEGKQARLVQRDRIGHTTFTADQIAVALASMGLPPGLPLSALAVELLPGGVGNDLPDRRRLASGEPAAGQAAATSQATATQGDPLGSDLLARPQRILRVSPLVAVAPAC